MIKNPIILDENGCLYFFKSKEDAELYIEPEDVKNSEYIAYDGEGRLLRLDLVEKNKSNFLGMIKSTQIKVNIVSIEELPNHSDELEQKLFNFLQQISSNASEKKKYTLRELLQKTINLSGYCS